jgi:hypothetical protein
MEASMFLAQYLAEGLQAVDEACGPWPPPAAVVAPTPVAPPTSSTASRSSPPAPAIAIGPAQPEPTGAARDAAIDALAVPGTEAVVARIKADPTITIDQAAAQILTAYKRARGLVGGAPASPVGGITPTKTLEQARIEWNASAATRRGPLINFFQLREAARNDWRASPQLQRQHESAEAYANFAEGVARGRIWIHGAGVVRTPSAPVRPE